MFMDRCRVLGQNNYFSDPNNYTGPWVVGKPGGASDVGAVGIDDPDMAVQKANFVLDKGLGGAFLWDITQDDASGTCRAGANPITNSASAVLRSSFYTTTVPPSTSTIATTDSMTNTSLNSSTTVTQMTPGNWTMSTKRQAGCLSANAIFADPTSCRKFNICLNGTSYGTEYPLGQYFNRYFNLRLL